MKRKNTQKEKTQQSTINVDESKLGKEETKNLINKVTREVSGLVLSISAKLESELNDLSFEEKRDYLKELGVEASALDQIIRKGYELLGLITFFTIAGGKHPKPAFVPSSGRGEQSSVQGRRVPSSALVLRQVQAWPLRAATTALRASGVVHTDMQKGFIKAEVIKWEKLVEAKRWKSAAEKGQIRLEGRDYEVKDGDVIEFKFSV